MTKAKESKNAPTSKVVKTTSHSKIQTLIENGKIKVRP